MPIFEQKALFHNDETPMIAFATFGRLKSKNRDMTKSELNARLAALLETDDITSVKEEIKSIKEAFAQAIGADPIEGVTAEEAPEIAEPIVSEEIESAEVEINSDEPEVEVPQSEEADAEGAEATEAPEEPKVKTEDDIFRVLLRKFNKRMAEHRANVERQREDNLKAKEQLIIDMHILVSKDEESYKSLFEEFNRLNDAWKAAGQVPTENMRDINERFYHAKNNFFYKFRIHQELRDLDLKKNRTAREAVIARTAELAPIENIKALEELLDVLKHDWNESGVVSQEDFKELADKFYGTIRPYEERISGHYQGLRQEQEKNIALKKDIIARAQSTAASEESDTNNWKAKTDAMLALQEEWKGVGFIKRDRSEELWKEFREVCDAFFGQRNAKFKEMDAASEMNKVAKQKLIERANALKDSAEWGKTTKEVKALQEEWKNSGKLRFKDEDKLWKAFRKACNHFFDRKKAHFGEIIGEQENNLFLKNNLIEEVEKYEFTGERHADLAKLKEFNERWNAIGFVPKNDIDASIKRFRAALDKHFARLDADQEERQLNRFREKLQSGSAPKDDFQLKREQQFLRDKIDGLKHEILQYKSNMMIFTGAGAASLHKEIEKKIVNAEKEIEQLKKKLDILRSLKPAEQ